MATHSDLIHRMTTTRRIIILTEGHTEPETAKTASCVIRYRPDEVVAVLDKTQRGKSSQELLGVGGSLPIVGELSEAPAANTLLLGIAPPGGRLPDRWRAVIRECLCGGLSILSGLHTFLSDDPEFSQLAFVTGLRDCPTGMNAANNGESR